MTRASLLQAVGPGATLEAPLLSKEYSQEAIRAVKKGLLPIIFFLGVNLVTPVSSISTVHADDYISPDLVKVTTPHYRPNRQIFRPKLGVYEYSVGWEGITAASCAVTISRKDGTYVVDAAARTYTGVDLLYKLRYEAIGTISAEDFSSISLSIDHRENSRRKNIEMSFLPDQGSITATRGKGADDPEKKTVSFSPNNLTLDPIGAVFLARGLEWKIGDTKHFDVFNGKSRYFISLSAIERTTINYKGEQRPVIVISPQVRNLTTTKPRAKLREAFIYVSDDESRDVLRIVSSVFIGSVITELESFTPQTTLANPLELVQANSDTDARARMR